MQLQHYMDELAKCLIGDVEDPSSQAYARMMELITAYVRPHSLCPLASDGDPVNLKSFELHLTD